MYLLDITFLEQNIISMNIIHIQYNYQHSSLPPPHPLSPTAQKTFFSSDSALEIPLFLLHFFFVFCISFFTQIFRFMVWFVHSDFHICAGLFVRSNLFIYSDFVYLILFYVLWCNFFSFVYCSISLSLSLFF